MLCCMRAAHQFFHVYVCLQLFAFPPFLLELGFQPLTLQTLKASGVPTGLTQRSSKMFVSYFHLWLLVVFN